MRATLILAAGCASLPAPERDFETRVAAVLERRGVGSEALLVIDNPYEGRFFAQAAAAFGIGALIDLGGNDRYRLEAWGQGFALGQGLGLLWDRDGEDHYAVAGVPDVFNRGAGLSGAQGAAFGYRGRLGGGVCILRDDNGDDHYEAQIFAGQRSCHVKALLCAAGRRCRRRKRA